MISYVIRRLLLAIPTLVGVATLVFLLIHLVPGDPVESMLGEYATDADKETLKQQLGLDKPLYEQYFLYFGGIVTADLGTSVSIEGEPPVAEVLANAYPYTLLLAVSSMLVALAIAVPAGMISALKRGTAWDSSLSVISLVGLSMPNFWLGPLLMLVFAISLGWLPVSGLENPLGLILPALTMGTSLAAILTRMVRASVIEELGQDYIRTARAKGLSEYRVVVHHAFRNSLIPIISIIGLQFGTLLAGAVVSERIFSIQGVGFILIEAINRRDYPLVQGAVLIVSVTYVLVNLLTDVLYAAVDPRVRLK